MRCAIYVYTFEPESANEEQKQIQQLKQFSAREHWQIVRIYRDRRKLDIPERKAFNLMLEEASKHRFDVLLFWTLTQLSPEGALPTLRLLTQLTDWGLFYRSFTEPYLDSCGPHQQAVVSVLATITQQQSRHISRNTRKGLAQQKNTGKPGPNGRIGPGQPPADFDRGKAQRLREVNGLSYAEIAFACGVSKATIYRFIKDPLRKLKTKNSTRS